MLDLKLKWETEDNIPKTNECADKDKLIIFIHYIFDKSISTESFVKKYYEIQAFYQNKFDNSVKIIIVPSFNPKDINRIDVVNSAKLNDDSCEKLTEICDLIKNIF